MTNTNIWHACSAHNTRIKQTFMVNTTSAKQSTITCLGLMKQTQQTNQDYKKPHTKSHTGHTTNSKQHAASNITVYLRQNKTTKTTALIWHWVRYTSLTVAQSLMLQQQ